MWPVRFPWIRWTSIFVLLTGIVLASLPASAASHTPDAHMSVVGKWNLQVTFPDGHQEASQVIFNQNGTFVNLTPAPGGGKWVSSEKSSSFSYVFSEVILTNGAFTVLVEVEQSGKLSADGKTYTASGTGSVYDATTGNLIVINRTTTIATRV